MLRSVALLALVAASSAFGSLPTATPRLRRAPAITSLKARDCVFDQEPCESSGECRVNSQFCDDNHGFYPGMGKPCARKATPKKAEMKPEVAKIFAEVAAEQERGRQSTK